MSPDDSVDLSMKDDSKWSDQDHLKFRVNAIKGLIALLNGETESGVLMSLNFIASSTGNKEL